MFRKKVSFMEKHVIKIWNKIIHISNPSEKWIEIFIRPWRCSEITVEFSTMKFFIEIQRIFQYWWIGWIRKILEKNRRYIISERRPYCNVCLKLLDNLNKLLFVTFFPSRNLTVPSIIELISTIFGSSVESFSLDKSSLSAYLIFDILF
jgi:hypothetical protein